MAWWAKANRRGRGAAAAAAERRLEAFARQWRPPSVDAAPRADDAWSAGVDVDRRPSVIGGWTRSSVRALALLVAVALAVAAYWAWSGRPRPVAEAPRILATGVSVSTGRTVEPSPTANTGPSVDPAATGGASALGDTPAPIPEVVVDVSGLVARPGLVRLPLGARVNDAIVAAGGFTRPRAAESVNLARVLVDGEQVVVSLTPVAATAPTAAGAGMTAAGPVDLNLASQTLLEGLPGIGPVIAQRIVQWRTDNGAFRSVDELGEVSGIGDAILTQLRPLVRV
jgi:competence protein ComEA